MIVNPLSSFHPVNASRPSSLDTAVDRLEHVRNHTVRPYPAANTRGRRVAAWSGGGCGSGYETGSKPRPHSALKFPEAQATTTAARSVSTRHGGGFGGSVGRGGDCPSLVSGRQFSAGGDGSVGEGNFPLVSAHPLSATQPRNAGRGVIKGEECRSDANNWQPAVHRTGDSASGGGAASPAARCRRPASARSLTLNPKP